MGLSHSNSLPLVGRVRVGVVPNIYNLVLIHFNHRAAPTPALPKRGREKKGK
jgi:hypothetical protein